MPSILIVDDSMFQRRLLKKHLADLDVELLMAADGVEALAILGQHKPACVVMDLMMPNMDGFELLDQIGMTIPVVVLTADIQHATYEDCVRLGARAVLVKPVSKAQIQQAVVELM